LADLDPEVRAWVVENERYVQAGAGKKTKAGLCMGHDETSAGPVICVKNSLTQRNNFCRRHQHLNGTLPVRYTGTPGVAAAARKLTNAQANEIRHRKSHSPKLTHKQLADEFGVSEGAIGHIIQHRTYKPRKSGKRNHDW
jgi:hypothetical protein